MATRELETINTSGELTEIKLGGTSAGDKLLTSDEIDAKIDLINESWGVITSASQEPDANMKVGDWYTSSINQGLTNFGDLVPKVGQRVYKTEGGFALGAAATDFDYYAVPYSGARTDVDLGVYDISAANLTPLTYGVFAALTTPATTTTTSADTFYPINGTFDNTPSVGFTATVDPAIQYTGEKETYFEIDWHCTFKNNTANSTISVGISDADGTVYPYSIMKTYAKNADELYSLSGTVVVQLITDNKIQLNIASDNDGDIITVNNFTTTIRTFII